MFLEHDQIDSYLNEMTFQSMDEVGLGLKSFHCGICQKTGKAKQDIETLQTLQSSVAHDMKAPLAAMM